MATTPLFSDIAAYYLVGKADVVEFRRSAAILAAW